MWGSASPGSGWRLPTTLTTVVDAGASPKVPTTSWWRVESPISRMWKPARAYFFASVWTLVTNGQVASSVVEPAPRGLGADRRADAVGAEDDRVREPPTVGGDLLADALEVGQVLDEVDAVLLLEPVHHRVVVHDRVVDGQVAFATGAFSAAASATASIAITTPAQKPRGFARWRISTMAACYPAN